jgi:hypothetical protein
MYAAQPAHTKDMIIGSRASGPLQCREHAKCPRSSVPYYICVTSVAAATQARDAWKPEDLGEREYCRPILCWVQSAPRLRN